MRGEQNNILFPVRISWANNFPNLSPFAPPLGLCSSSWGGAPNPPFFFSLQKKKAKRLAPREAIKFIFIRAFYNSLRSDK